MRAFTDSSGLAADGAALAKRMARDGYLFLPGLLPPAAVQEVRRRCLEVIAAAGWLRAGRPVEEAVAEPAAACVDPDDAFVAVLARLYRLEALHALKHHPALMALFERLLGDEVLVHPLVIPRNVFPGRPELTTPAHQDFPHIQGTAETFTAWIPLGDCPRAMGGLAIAAGSHRDGVRDFRVASGAGAMEVTDVEDDSWACGDFAAGDVLIFHSMAVHKALANRGDRLRQSIDVRYQRAREPVTEVSLSPYAGMGGWDEIYQGWKSEARQYYWRAMAPRVAPFDRQYYDQRDEMAFAMAERGDDGARASLQRIVQRDPDAAKRGRAADLLGGLVGR